MRLAILGTDPDVLALVAAATADGHQLAWLGDVRRDDESSLRQWTTRQTARPDEWETLLDHATADGVIVGRGAAAEELRIEQLKRLIADAVPLLVVHPAGPSLLAYYELDMVRRETHDLVRHFNPLTGHPMLAELARWVREGHESIGPVHQVTCTRHVASGQREIVLDALARDAELLAKVGGDIRRVSAIGPQLPPPGATGSASAASTVGAISYASLQVQMTTGGPATLRWSVTPSPGAAGIVELTLVGERGTILWRQGGRSPVAASEQPELELRLSGQEPQRLTLPAYDPPATSIREFAAAVTAGESRQLHSDNDKDKLSTWDKATRAIEVVDAVELSLQKGRTIEVYQQQLTEQLAFRGTMAALGCGLLLLGTAVMFIAAIVGGADWLLQRPVMRAWPIIVLAVLAFFLLLQCVPWLATRQKARRQQRQELADEDWGDHPHEA